jgi:putative membrane protein
MLAAWVIAAIDPRYPRDWLLENLLVFFFAGLLFGTRRLFTFSNLNYGLFALFLTLHLMGSHYTYSEVPFGAWLQETFDLSRNHYDRLVHFSYGLLTANAFRELLARSAGVTSGWMRMLAVSCVLSFSSFFECLEAVVAMIVSPELGDAYLGTQGDTWDAQKDTLLALLGALMTMGLHRAWRGTKPTLGRSP